MEEKKISVIIPVYNTEKYIKRCIESIVNQSYKNLEIILVLDGTEENELPIIEAYKKTDPRIIIIDNGQNLGLFRTRINGFKASTGDYIAFVDSDDYISCDFFRGLIEKALEEKSDITFATTVIESQNGSKCVNVLQDTFLNLLPMNGDELRRVFFMQQGYAYVWHTIWNKLYSRELWVGVIDVLDGFDKHVVMTEDIAFSTVLITSCVRSSRNANSVYYYCQHEDTSTSSKNIAISKFSNKVNDIAKVFDFLDSYLENKDEEYIRGFSGLKKYYGRIYRRSLNNYELIEDSERKRINDLIDSFYNGECGSTEDIDRDNYFLSTLVPYNDCIELIRRKILFGKEQYISFDIFDTLLVRPFYEPRDLFKLLDDIYDDEFPHSRVSFSSIRCDAENLLRKNTYEICGVEDIDIDKIYRYIEEFYCIPQDLCNRIKEFEISLEEYFSTRRNSGYELYQLAKICGKHIILISDMYFTNEILDDFLRKNGYNGFERIYVSSNIGKLKYNGKLFEYVLNDLNINGNEILHIGDDYEKDVQGGNSVGIKTSLLYKSNDVFYNKIDGIETNRLSSIGKDYSGVQKYKRNFENNNGYGSASSIVANTYFDNPCRYFHPLSDFNIDPYLLGFYVVGLNLVGQIEWMAKLQETHGFGKIIFTSRDGYLLYKAINIADPYCKRIARREYKYVSRTSMLPITIYNKEDFINLPIVFNRYSPYRIKELAKFALEINDAELNDICTELHIDAKDNFKKKHEYLQCINKLLAYYSKYKHDKAKTEISTYWNDICDTDAIFDLGYSGSIHAAICDASKAKPTALFIHKDTEKCETISRREKFKVVSLLDDTPTVSGILREFLFSDLSGSCIGYETVGGEVKPMFEPTEDDFINEYPIRMIHRGAIDFVRKFYEFFGKYIRYLDIRVEDFIAPLEGFLSNPSTIDLQMFKASVIEDKLYGGNVGLNLKRFWIQATIETKGGDDGNHLLNNVSKLMKEENKDILCFFGTGKICKRIMEENDIQVNFFLDNDTSKEGREFYGAKICSPKKIDSYSNIFVVITSAYYSEIEDQLDKVGLRRYKDYISYVEVL